VEGSPRIRMRSGALLGVDGLAFPGGAAPVGGTFRRMMPDLVFAGGFLILRLAPSLSDLEPPEPM
jgi:hypothetical protein